MRARSALALIPAGVAAWLIAVASPSARASRVSAPAALDAAPGAEVRRVRAHFDSVLRELGARDVSRLSAEQRERRSALVERLRAYRDRGDFPHNYDFPAEMVPYFVDRETGALCAVGHLLATTGRRDMVDRVARTNNNVRVAQLATDTAFAGWLDAHGLTLNEAARIQPTYGPPTTFERHPELTLGTSAAAAGSVVMAVLNGTANADGRSSMVSGLGLTIGVAAVVLGAKLAGVDYGSRSLGTAGMVTGVASIAFSIRGIRRRTEMPERETERAAREQREGVRAAMVPLVGVAEGRSTAGVGVSVRF